MGLAAVEVASKRPGLVGSTAGGPGLVGWARRASAGSERLGLPLLLSGGRPIHVCSQLDVVVRSQPEEYILSTDDGGRETGTFSHHWVGP